MFLFSVTEWEGSVLHLSRISRVDMGDYLCIASNGVPPTVSKRIRVSVDCELSSISVYRRRKNRSSSTPLSRDSMSHVYRPRGASGKTAG